MSNNSRNNSEKRPSSWTSIIPSTSTLASVLMVVYMGSSLFGLYQLMYPLARVDLSQYSETAEWVKVRYVHLFLG